MLSIFVMYSNDRYHPFDIMLGCLMDMPEFESCQKTLVVDGKFTGFVPHFDIVQVPRHKGQFNWSNMWDAGVATARHDVILYLDSDRLLPKDYLSHVLEEVKDNVFVFTSRHFMMLKEMHRLDCQDFLSRSQDDVFSGDDFIGEMVYEPRYHDPISGPGKNVMSGNTAFTRKTFLDLGGVDPWYCGHGAFADTDFHTQAARAGCTFVDLQLPELHYFHHKKDGDQKNIKNSELKRMGLRNYIYYCHKWGHPLVLAEDLAFDIGIEDPQTYVKETLDKILADLPR
jgi:GT2 family glycosyltransferase